MHRWRGGERCELSFEVDELPAAGHHAQESIAVDRMKPEQMVAASNDVMFEIVRAIGFEPPIELERYA